MSEDDGEHGSSKKKMHARFDTDAPENDTAITRITTPAEPLLIIDSDRSGNNGSIEQPVHDGSVDDRKASIWSSNSFRRKSTAAQTQNSGKLLVELYELKPTKRKGIQWTETARWIKYEERVEGVDKFWSKPRVAFLSFHSLTRLRLCFMRGVVLLDQDAETYGDLLESVVNAMAKEYQIDESRVRLLRHTICGNREGLLNGPGNSKSAVGFVAKKFSSFARQHTVLKLEHLPARRASSTGADFGQPMEEIVSPENRKLTRMQTATNIPRPEDRKLSRKMTRFFHKEGGESATENTKEDSDFLRRLPSGVLGVQVLSGSASDQLHVKFAMVRLANPTTFPEYRNGQIPMKFIFVLIGPPSSDLDYHEVGRSLATLMANPNFQTTALTAGKRKDLVDAIDTFLDEGIVVPPVDIDKGVMNNVEDIKRALRERSRLQAKEEAVLESVTEGVEQSEPIMLKAKKPQEDENPLQRTGKLFGGLVRDIRKRAPYYCSDFKDALNLQCVTSVCFMFFAALAPAITFGGLLESKTNGWMGTSEVLVAQCLCGTIWSFFAAQPLLIMAATGPFLIFEGSLYEFCESQNVDFMTFRVWAGFWVFIAAIITVMLEGSFLIRYFTRFTEDIFATLVALIFIVESLKFVYKGFIYHPVKKMDLYCDSVTHYALLETNRTVFGGYNVSVANTSGDLILPQKQSHHGDLKEQPDTALLSAFLVLGTFYLSYQFRQLRSTIFLGRPLRRLVSDFGVPLAILIVVIIDFSFFNQPYVQHLVMSDNFSPTSPEKRGWFIYPFGDARHPFPIWAYFAAIIPAFLVYILIFVECELTELLLLRPERKLQKGGGFHWDLLLLGCLTLMTSLLGLPWMCAAVLQSLAHGSSLTIMKNRAPGQPPQVDRVVEQRVTSLVISLLTGIIGIFLKGTCAFLGFVLKEIPIAVLFGVFLFLGVMTLSGVDMTNRLVLMFVPQKYFPDHPYCQNVSMWRMHLYTFFQLVCLALMWTCKSIKQTALIFPFMLMVIALFRIFLLPKIFSEDELEALDGEEELEEDEDGEINMFGVGYV